MKQILILFFVVLASYSCTEDTLTIGSNVMPENEKAETTISSFKLQSSSVRLDSVLANTDAYYIGAMTNPELQSITTCNFLAQYNILENYRLPEKSQMITDISGNIIADSCNLVLYFNQFYGDSLSTMKLSVQELDTNNVLKEDKQYYTTINPLNYVNTEAKKYYVTYNINDILKSRASLSKQAYKGMIKVRLDNRLGNFILNKYYENPNNYKNAYQFIRHVLPGFFIKNEGGVGAILKIELSHLDVFYRYHAKQSDGKDSIVNTINRLVSTQEVIQTTQVENFIPNKVLDKSKDFSYIQSPSGIVTSIKLPVEEMTSGKYSGDSINQAKLTLSRYLETKQLQHFNVPQGVLLVSKTNYKAFFENKKLPDNINSFFAPYNPLTSSYNFDNISRLILTMRDLREVGAKVLQGDRELIKAEKYKKWEKLHPDWNEVLIIPVDPQYNDSKVSGVGKSLIAVKNLLSPSFVKLYGGESSKYLYLSVIYSKFK